MIEIKLKKLSHGVFVPLNSEKHEYIFNHIAKNGSSKYYLQNLELVFELHGCKLVFPVTCEDTGTLWRVSDGAELKKQEDGRYYFVWGPGPYGSQFGYEFESLNDGYNFTSKKEEIKNEK